jgi:hypothetical protein
LGFAFPYGDYGYESRNVEGDTAIIRNITQELFPMNFYQPFGKETSANIPSHERIFYIRRITVRPDWSADDLINHLTDLAQ